MMIESIQNDTKSEKNQINTQWNTYLNILNKYIDETNN